MVIGRWKFKATQAQRQVPFLSLWFLLFFLFGPLLPVRQRLITDESGEEWEEGEDKEGREKHADKSWTRSRKNGSTEDQGNWVLRRGSLNGHLFFRPGQIPLLSEHGTTVRPNRGDFSSGAPSTALSIEGER